VSFAATINVNSGCSVRNAIASVNAGAGVGGCSIQGTGAVTINIPSGTFTFSTASVIVLRAVTISGAGTSATILQFPSTGNFGAGLTVDSGGQLVTIRNLTLRGLSGNRLNGLYNATGDVTLSSVRVTAFGLNGISQFSTMRLDLCTIDHNGSSGSLLGGGINNQPSGTTMVTRTNITNNTAVLGGGVFVGTGSSSGTNFTIDHSLIYQNNADDQGGGIYAEQQMEVMNVTISGNTATNQGGGIRFDSSANELHIRQSTIAYNTSRNGSGGGLSVGAFGTPVVVCNIFANNTARTAPDIEWTGTSANASYNLIRNTSGWSAALFPTGSPFKNKVGVDPQLQPLQNQGGPTSVHPIVAGSPPFDAIPNSVGSGISFPDDQRGLPRPRRNAYDIGAYELQ
jgi:Chlamydia polymorphic membrane protein (Chlamydia_PMP) repeat